MSEINREYKDRLLEFFLEGNMCLTEYNEAETMQMFKEEGREEGIAIGAGQRDKEKITDMLRRGKTVEEIVDFCDYPYEQVKEIADALEA